jgi:hypothetical protein
MFKEVIEIINTNAALHEDNHYYRYMNDSHIALIVMGLRRQIKNDKQSISIVRLLNEISIDGLLENNTILKIREHTTDTHGYTEIIFALCHLLGFDFMPRIRDLKDQQLYRVEKEYNNG